MSNGVNGRFLVIAIGAALMIFIGLQKTILAPSTVAEHNSELEAQIVQLKSEIQELVRENVNKQIQSMPIARKQDIYPIVRKRTGDQMRILVTGGAGFVGSHLVDMLMLQGHKVTVMDNLFTGRKENIVHWIGHPNFDFLEHDVTVPIHLEVDQIYHMACPASPPHYQYDPIKTIRTSTEGTLNMLNLARDVKARILFTSTSEVYGDPKVDPQPETYWGHVNPIGPRACYDEGKRVAETMCYAFQQTHDVEVRVARIFNTFGPRMNKEDGRVVSNFVIQALKGQRLTIYGSGKQTRSFQYVSDLVAGLLRLMNSNFSLPVNLGNPHEFTVNDFAEYVSNMVGDTAGVDHKEASVDDPQQRRPDITRAKKELGWSPKWKVEDGLKKTIEYFREELMPSSESTPAIWLSLSDM